MEHSIRQFVDLPDELLLMIFKNMKKALALYSLMGINRRFDKVLRDPIFVSRLTVMTCSSNGLIYPMRYKTIDRFCLHILPQIHYKIQWLNLEALSMERILLAADYPNLHGIGLYNIKLETAERYFIDKSSLADIFKNKISMLVIKIDKSQTSIKDAKITILSHVLSIFINACCLNFDPSFQMENEPISFNWQLIQPFSSLILKELHINVKLIDHCLYLLNGCLNQLEKFYVNIDHISPHSAAINKKEQLSNLKCFSLTSNTETGWYDELIVPLLHRMSNLERLALYLMDIDNKKKERFIDGNYLKENIIDHLPRLNKLAFNIHSTTFFNQIYLPSNEDIQNTFTNFKDNQIISSVVYSRNKKGGRCHIYSLPYTMKYYKNITNNFPGGLFKSVREISLADARPFEHEFFIRIAQAFPYLNKLSLTNEEPQQHKQSQRSMNEKSQEHSVIKYPHLTELDLFHAHEDYVAQFLDHTKAYLPKNIKLHTQYNLLQSVTHNFTGETTRINCAKINNLMPAYPFTMTKQFIMYFPLVKPGSMSL